MEKFLVVILTIVGVMGLIFIAGFIAGLFLWLLWPVAIPAAFPGAVAAGVLVSKLTLWQSICLCWVFGLLVKSTQTNNNK